MERSRLVMDAMGRPQEPERVRRPVIDVVNEIVRGEREEPRRRASRGGLPQRALRVHRCVEPQEGAAVQRQHTEPDEGHADVRAKLVRPINPAPAAHRDHAFDRRRGDAESE
jgi:hypothetical protein